MNNEERVKLLFETISKIAGFEIKPGKDFYIVANGNKIKHHIRSDLALMKLSSYDNIYINRGYVGFVSLLNGDLDCQLEEIKELLTEDEKEFLRDFEFSNIEILTRGDEDSSLAKSFYLVLKLDYTYLTGHKFEGLETNKKYTREELGL